MPEQFEGGGEKERVAGGGNGAKKKRVPTRGGCSPARALCYC